MASRSGNIWEHLGAIWRSHICKRYLQKRCAWMLFLEGWSSQRRGTNLATLCLIGQGKDQAPWPGWDILSESRSSDYLGSLF